MIKSLQDFNTAFFLDYGVEQPLIAPAQVRPEPIPAPAPPAEAHPEPIAAPTLSSWNQTADLSFVDLAGTIDAPLGEPEAQEDISSSDMALEQSPVDPFILNIPVVPLSKKINTGAIELGENYEDELAAKKQAQKEELSKIALPPPQKRRKSALEIVANVLICLTVLIAGISAAAYFAGQSGVRGIAGYSFYAVPSVTESYLPPGSLALLHDLGDGSMGDVVFSIPNAGFTVDFMQGNPLLVAAIYVAMLVLAIALKVSVSAKRPKKKGATRLQKVGRRSPLAAQAS